MNFRMRKKCPYFDTVDHVALGDDGPVIDLENITENMIHQNINKWKSCLPSSTGKVLNLVSEVLIIQFPGDKPGATEIKIAVPLYVPLENVNIEEEVAERAKYYEIDNSDNDSVVSLSDIYLEIPEAQLEYWIYPQCSDCKTISYS